MSIDFTLAEMDVACAVALEGVWRETRRIQATEDMPQCNTPLSATI